MFDSVQELLGKIRLGEDSLLELKEVRFAGGRVAAPSRNDLADELAALANSRGGLCVLGVDDKTREVVGIPVEHLEAVESLVREVCNDSIRPAIAPHIEKFQLPMASGETVPVLKVDVPRSLFVHLSPGGYFLRIGSSKRLMQPDYLARLFQQRSQARIVRFDEQSVPNAVLGDLSVALWQRFAPRQAAVEAPEVVLHKLGLACKDEDGTWRPSVSGVLLATEDPRQFLPNAFIQAVAYRGETSTPSPGGSAYQLDAEDITGPLDRQVEGALRFVRRNMRVEARKYIGRQDVPQYDLAAVFEALVNAVAHRDYSIYGSKIRLRMYSDRLELYSPGALANTMTVESLILRQSARNEVLTSLLARCPVSERAGLETDRSAMMDKRGEGVRIVLDRTEALAGKPAEYRMIDGEELLLVIPAASAMTAPERGK